MSVLTGILWHLVDFCLCCGCRWWPQGGGGAQVLPQLTGRRQRLSQRLRLLHPVWMLRQQGGCRAAHRRRGFVMQLIYRWILWHLGSFWVLVTFVSSFLFQNVYNLSVLTSFPGVEAFYKCDTFRKKTPVLNVILSFSHFIKIIIEMYYFWFFLCCWKGDISLI